MVVATGGSGTEFCSASWELCDLGEVLQGQAVVLAHLSNGREAGELRECGTDSEVTPVGHCLSLSGCPRALSASHGWIQNR